MFKKIAIGLGVIVVVIAVGIYYAASNADKMVKTAIESNGSRVTQVAVALDAVDLSLQEMKAGLRGLTVANPPGFKTARAVSLGEISVDIGDISREMIVIDEIMVRAPEITYEIGSGGSNIATIQENVDNFMKVAQGGGSAGESAGSSSSGGESAGPKVVISNLYIQDGKVNVSASLMQGKTLTTPLPNIHLTDIGKDSGGATPAEVVDQVIAAITKHSGSAASSLDLSQLGLSDISGKAAEMGKAAGDAAKKAMEDAAGSAGGAGDAAKKAVDDAASGLKGLFGN